MIFFYSDKSLKEKRPQAYMPAAFSCMTHRILFQSAVLHCCIQYHEILLILSSTKKFLHIEGVFS